MATTRTYAVGEVNTVRRLDNHTLPWVEVDVPDLLGLPWTIYDVMADPNNPDYVTVVGQNFGPGTGIMVSYDAGVTWNIPGGNWNQNKLFYEVWYVDSQTIWAVGDQGLVVKSTDGGATFNATGTRPANMAATAAIHAISDQVAVVAGSPSQTSGVTEAYVWKTIDGGFSWIPLNGGNTLLNNVGIAGVVGYAQGIWISDDQQRIVVTTNYTQQLSTDAGLTFTDIAPEMSRSGRHLTWYPSYDSNPPNMKHFGGPVIHLNDSTDNGGSYSILRDEEWLNILGAHFYSVNNGYYTAGNTVYATSDGGVTGNPSIIIDTIENLQAVWTQSANPIYRLEDCTGEAQTVYSESTILSAYVGQIVQVTIAGLSPDVCWTVFVEEAPDPTVPLFDITSVDNVLQDCSECLDPDCYDLISCNGACDDILNVELPFLNPVPAPGTLVTINGDTSCVYEIYSGRYAYYFQYDHNNFSNPASPFQLGTSDVTFEVTSLVYNSTELVTSPVSSYIMTPTNYLPTECNGFTCNIVPVNTTENGWSNLAQYLATVFNNFGLPMDAEPADPADCNIGTAIGEDFFKIRYRDGDTFTITLNISSNTFNDTWVLQLNTGNISIHSEFQAGFGDIETCVRNTPCTQAPNITSVELFGGPCPTILPEPELGEACPVEPSPLRIGEPGFSWKNCDPEEVVIIKNKFAESVFNMFKRMRYGITTCCEFDLDKIDIKNSLLDLGYLYDPELCEPTGQLPEECCWPPCDVVVRILLPEGVACPAPTNAATSIELEPTREVPCDAPEGLLGPSGDVEPIVTIII